ncbi:hypothetical protein OEZ86_008603 [Tetradesmus obliquus]|nr:hypothetical protein OEZ86_008603 [Tetradesmus obliquus]
MSPPDAAAIPDPVAYDSTWYLEKVDKIGQKVKAAPAAAANVGFAKETEAIPHSGPQGKVVPLTIIDDPADWRASELKPADYTYHLSPAEVAELIAATEAILARSVKDEEDIKKLTREDYHLPTLGPKLIELADKEVTNGRGFLIIKGFPVQHFASNRPGLVVAFWGWALLLGRVQISQTDWNSKGEVFGSIFNHVTVGRFADMYTEPHNEYTKKGDDKKLSFHSDQGATDLIALLSLSAAKEGGESQLVSAITIHNELLRRGRKDLVEVLSTPGIWHTAKQETQRSALPNADGSYAEYEETQPFEYHGGYLSVHFGARKFADTAKQLTPLQEEAIWAVAAIAEDPAFHLSLKLEPGDVELLHNPSTFHARTHVVDGTNRHLVRWWVHSDSNKRPVAPHYAPRSNVGDIGGFLVPHYPDLSKQRLPLYPYSRHDGLGQSHVE